MRPSICVFLWSRSRPAPYNRRCTCHVTQTRHQPSLPTTPAARSLMPPRTPLFGEAGRSAVWWVGGGSRIHSRATNRVADGVRTCHRHAHQRVDACQLSVEFDTEAMRAALFAHYAASTLPEPPNLRERPSTSRLPYLLGGGVQRARVGEGRRAGDDVMMARDGRGRQTPSCWGIQALGSPLVDGGVARFFDIYRPPKRGDRHHTLINARGDVCHSAAP